MELKYWNYLGESFQDYSWIQDFEAIFYERWSQSIVLGRLYKLLIYFLSLFIFCRHTVSYKNWKFRISEIISFHLYTTVDLCKTATLKKTESWFSRPVIA